ncbi:hypothetical protein [Yoonia sp.]|uniref:hypothetical protein n=1 Tax=Yoonia sp. TaxID=2212373 RepID=UPI004048C106
MFFNKQKKLNVRKAEFCKLLRDFTGISEIEAQRYFELNLRFIEQSYERGLDTFGVLFYIAEKSMEKIHDAHYINQVHIVKDIPDYLLLVSLQAGQMLIDKMPEDELSYNTKYWRAVLKLPIDPENPDRTYSDRLHELVAEYKLR